jgi:IrrE N-terminal-like domain
MPGHDHIRTWVQRDRGFDSELAWVRSAATQILAQTNQVSPPISLREILKQKAIAARFVPDLDVEARLDLRGDRFSILLHPRLRRYRNRARFTVAHELGHTLFYDLDARPPRKMIPKGYQNRFEESLCNSFAGELLIPFDYVSRLCEQFEEKSELEKAWLLSRIATDCEVAQQVAAFHLVRTLGWWKSILVFTARVGKGGPGTDSDVARRIIWSWYPPELDGRLYLPGYSSKSGKTFPKLRINEFDVAVTSSTAHSQLLRVSSKSLKVGNLSKTAARLGEEVDVWLIDWSTVTAPDRSSALPKTRRDGRDETLVTIPLGNRTLAATE